MVGLYFNASKEIYAQVRTERDFRLWDFQILSVTTCLCYKTYQSQCQVGTIRSIVTVNVKIWWIILRSLLVRKNVTQKFWWILFRVWKKPSDHFHGFDESLFGCHLLPVLYLLLSLENITRTKWKSETGCEVWPSISSRCSYRWTTRPARSPKQTIIHTHQQNALVLSTFINGNMEQSLLLSTTKIH